MRPVRDVLIGVAEEEGTIAVRGYELRDHQHTCARCHHDHLFALDGPTVNAPWRAVKDNRPRPPCESASAPLERPFRTYI